MPSSIDQTLNRLATLEPNTRERAYWLIWIGRYYGAPVIISSARRTALEQQQLYAQGRSVPGQIVTNTLVSRHMTGKAFDIDMYATAADDVPLELWQAFGQVGEYLGLTWGGRWAMRDWRHFET